MKIYIFEKINVPKETEKKFLVAKIIYCHGKEMTREI